MKLDRKTTDRPSERYDEVGGDERVEIKTWQPITPDGEGPICEDHGDATLELLTAFNSDVNRDVALSGHAFDAAFVLFAHVLSGLADGDHAMFGGDYAVHVRYYTREQLDVMPEFSGY